MFKITRKQRPAASVQADKPADKKLPKKALGSERTNKEAEAREPKKSGDEALLDQPEGNTGPRGAASPTVAPLPDAPQAPLPQAPRPPRQILPDLPPPKAYAAVFCGGSSGPDRRHAENAAALGRALATAGFGLVFGGSGGGSMGAVCDAVLRSGGHVIGVAPDLRAEAPQLQSGYGHRFQMLPTAGIDSRKSCMVALSDALVVLPGGWGTFDEVTFIATHPETRDRAVVLLDSEGFYAPLARHAARLQQEAFPNHAAHWRLCATPQEAMEAIKPAIADGQKDHAS